MDNFFDAYVTAALWSSTDDADEPLDSNYTAADLAPETAAKMLADCEKFLAENGELLTDENCERWPGECTVLELAGHDFWLTRNGHGAGFWDGDWAEPAAAILTTAAHAFGEFDLYIGDDGKIWA